MSTFRHPLRRPALVARGRRGTRGQALVEFALILPVFLLLLVALFDAGRIVYAQNAITQAARDAVRVGAVSTDYTQVKYDSIRNKALSSAIGVSITGTNVTGQAGACVNPAAPPPAATDPSGTCFYPVDKNQGDPVVVNISVTMPLITPLLSNILGGSITLTTHAEGLVQCTGC